MNPADDTRRSMSRSDRIVAIAVWTFAVLEAVGIAVMLWSR